MTACKGLDTSGNHEWRGHCVMHIMYSHSFDSVLDMKDFEVSLCNRAIEHKTVVSL